MANGSDDLIPTFTGVADANWQVFGSGFLYIPPATITNRASTMSVQAFPISVGATVALYESNRSTLASFNAMLDGDGAAISSVIAADENDIMHTNDVVRCKYTAVYVEGSGTVEFATSIR